MTNLYEGLAELADSTDEEVRHAIEKILTQHQQRPSHGQPQRPLRRPATWGSRLPSGSAE